MKSNIDHKLDGTYKRSRHGVRMTATPGAPECPKHLTGVARERWHVIVPILCEEGVIARIDDTALAAYCTTWATYVAADAIIQAEGLIVESPQGTKPNPAVGIRRAALADLHRYAREFGMSPRARTAIKTDIKRAVGEDGLDELATRAAKG